ncbi:hypothetical protein PSH03_005409 [Micromonospora sp. PSH03]|uniref:hypothetical protein n=1 Tax=Micromonospora salmantinae TaxID=2911211 RepID=UPI001EE8539D|nr:hypothetical protein [Micromonospora salmantinae]MCG5459625.1 hypothetical protein [Micromonospora salmantinae]
MELRHTFASDDEQPLTPESVTVTVTREGSVTPDVEGSAIPDNDVWSFAAGALPEGVYSAVWDGGAEARDTEWFEVTGGLLFTVAEVRASDAELTANRWDAASVVRGRSRVDAEFHRITGRSFVPRTRTVQVTVSEGSAWLPFMDVLSATLSDSEGTPVLDFTSEPVGPFTAISGLSDGVYTAEVRYGFLSVPDDIRGAALLRLRVLLFGERSGIPDRATSWQPAEGGTYTLATAGIRGSLTGIPDVDAVLTRYRLSVVDDVLGAAL